MYGCSGKVDAVILTQTYLKRGSILVFDNAFSQALNALNFLCFNISPSRRDRIFDIFKRDFI